MRLRTKKLNSHQMKQYLDTLSVSPKKYNVGILTRKPCFTNLNFLNKTTKYIEKIQSTPQPLSILMAKEKIKKLYENMLLFYQTNQNKLIGIIKSQLVDKNYFYIKEILDFIKSMREKKHIKHKHYILDKFLNDLENLAIFLEEFYKKKCLRQIEIIQQSVINRQLVVRDATDYNSYKIISKNIRPTLLGDYDIYEQFKNISDKYGNFKEISNVQRALYQRMYESQKKIVRIFQQACILKENDKFLFKKKMNHY